MSWQERFMARFYDPGKGWTDGDSDFHALCFGEIPRGGKILEIGAGPTNATSDFLATIGEVHGVDVDPDVEGNRALASAAAIADDRYPFPDGTFDAAVSNYVVEHVADARAHLHEIARVLRPGAVYLLRTPNRFHYVALVSALTPHWFHVAVANRLRNRAADAHPPYPTVYAMNTRARLARMAEASGFDVARLDMVEKEPSYGMISPVLFLAFLAYERAVNASPLGEPLRANLFAVLRKR